jgi:OHCU decarboxylase
VARKYQRLRRLVESNAMDDRDTFVERYGPVFEHSPWVAEAAWEHGPFADREALAHGLEQAMYAAPRDRQLALIRAHPDLAGRAAVEGTLTASSQREQAAAGLDRLTPDEYETFRRTNAAYRERFGFPFVVCVREHTIPTILDAFARRLGHTSERELDTALEEVAKIASLRLHDRLEPGEEPA